MKEGYLVDEPAPGKYLPADSAAKLPAAKFYLPNDLPPELDLSADVVRAHGRAMHSLGRLDGFLSEIEDPDTALGLFVFKEAEQSSQVEGTQVTVSDMLRKDADSKDVREARNYVRALQEAADELRESGHSREHLSNEDLKSLHESLMESGRTDDEDPRPGEYRDQYIWIEEDLDFGRQIRFVPPKPEIATGKMENFEEYMQSEGEYPDLIDIGVLHYQIETIHPFLDGNGRVGRLLIVLMLLAADILMHPLFYLSSYIRRNRHEYTDLLLAVSEENCWEDWLLFFLRGMREQADEAFSRAKLILDLRDRYEQRYRDARPSVRELIDAIFEEPVFTVSRAAELTDRSYPATNSAIDRLESDGIIRETTGKERYREFQAEEVLNVLNKSVAEIPSPGELISETNSETGP
ncbi:filamentation induced by cAMP protein fic [Haloterrigena salina JCM 13891]|uniref:Filamentation induced by cAMP protein fic n=1 Tax=Haloterrigena salina JCM 13891 TaxID=1227488 RepID=M0BYV1_9EURY|nr:Fic family protein [Haloterrigena salina]ELZ16125.1 filamentation induced by cAMP protein fic [Haloterrigena salina JCM 13891]